MKLEAKAKEETNCFRPSHADLEGCPTYPDEDYFLPKIRAVSSSFDKFTLLLELVSSSFASQWP